jgi:hypothetical protein
MSLFLASRAEDPITCPRCSKTASRRHWVDRWYEIVAVVGDDTGMYLSCPYVDCSYSMSTIGGPPSWFAVVPA